MAQKTINVGTVANDGTGDTIRGAFTNVNANFTEVYGNIATVGPAYTTANAAFAEVNTVNGIVQTISISANSFSTSVGSAGNAYAVVIGSSGNAYTVAVGAAGNAVIQSVSTAGNNYTSILVANTAVGTNAWTNTVAVATYAWANGKFDTVTNTAIIIDTTNAAFTKANSALQNTSGTLGGNITITGTVTSTVGFYDGLGPVRERFLVVANANTPILVSHSVVISNSSNNIHIEIPNDNVFLSPANIGTTIEIYQFGTGDTKIVAQTAAVTVHSSNNWANIAGQYLSATAVKVLPNTWILTGDLKT